MQHCDEETLSLFALGEPAAPDVADHVAECPHCRSELAALQLVVSAARDVIADGLTVERVPPPPQLWDRIAAETGVTAGPRPGEVIRHATSGPAGRPWLSAAAPSRRTLRRPRTAEDQASDRAPGRGQTLRSTRVIHPNRPLLAVAAGCLAVGLVVGGLGTWLVTGRSDHTPAPLVVAQTALAGLALAPTAAGQADVVKTAQGRQLDLDVHQLAAPNGFYEVWLIDPTITKMVAVGVLSGGKGEFSLPAGVDLKNYPLVDISIQPLDGDPKHSGRSVLRGTLKS